jgi:hypothetical protein
LALNPDPYRDQADDFIDQALGTIADASASAEAAEIDRFKIETYLGSEAQQHGNVKDWQADEGPGYRSFIAKRKNRDELQRLGVDRQTLKGINSLFTDSYKAAAGGDLEKAEALRKQAVAAAEEAGVADLISGDHFKEKKIGGRAGKQLSSPMGQIVGEKLDYASDIQDPTSPETKALFKALEGDALAEIYAGETAAGRALATEERSMQRTIRDASAMHGGARSFTGEAAIAARSSERFGGLQANVHLTAGIARAKVHGEAARFYQDYRQALASDAVSGAQAYVQNLAFVNTNYQMLQATFASKSADIQMQAAQFETAFAGLVFQANEDRMNLKRRLAFEEKKAKGEAAMSFWSSVTGSVGGAATSAML